MNGNEAAFGQSYAALLEPTFPSFAFFSACELTPMEFSQLTGVHLSTRFVDEVEQTVADANGRKGDGFLDADTVYEQCLDILSCKHVANNEFVTGGEGWTYSFQCVVSPANELVFGSTWDTEFDLNDAIFDEDLDDVSFMQDLAGNAQELQGQKPVQRGTGMPLQSGLQP